MRGHREANLQPFGISSGLGISPFIEERTKGNRCGSAIQKEVQVFLSQKSGLIFLFCGDCRFDCLFDYSGLEAITSHLSRDRNIKSAIFHLCVLIMMLNFLAFMGRNIQLKLDDLKLI